MRGRDPGTHLVRVVEAVVHEPCDQRCLPDCKTRREGFSCDPGQAPLNTFHAMKTDKELKKPRGKDEIQKQEWEVGTLRSLGGLQGTPCPVNSYHTNPGLP